MDAPEHVVRHGIFSSDAGEEKNVVAGADAGVAMHVDECERMGGSKNVRESGEWWW